MNFDFTRKFALKRLETFVNENLKDYPKKRNFDFGVSKRNNVSCLSPYITHGLLTEYEVLEEVLKKYKYPEAKKFIDEIFWRIYWRGWLETRPKLWDDYTYSLSYLKKKGDYIKAISGNTNINCFNFWINEIKKYNYLHNHSRMWFASIWIFTLNLPWQLGAEFFLENLFDGDEASNTLSWRWVAGLQTKGKNYIAKKQNIELYSNHKVERNMLKKSTPIVENVSYEFEKFVPRVKKNFKNKNLLILENNLDFLYKENFLNKYKKIFILSLEKKFRLNDLSENVLIFKNNIILKAINDNSNIEIISYNKFIELIKEHKEFDVPYPFLGYNLDFIKLYKKKYNLKINFLYRELDLYCWQFTRRGFFNFKQNIPEIIKKLNL